MLTLKELSQLYYLNLEIEKQKQHLEKIETDAFHTTSELTGMPTGTNINDKVGMCAAEIADLKKLISENMHKQWKEKIRLEKYIQEIDDSMIRQIMRHRFIECLSWEQVAEKIKGVTSYSVKKQCYRYLKKH